MSHYFSKNIDTKSQEKPIRYTFENKQFTFITDHGVFSKNHVDDATDLLLKHMVIDQGASLLDLGTGYGVIGICLNKIYQTKTTMIDVNERAVELAKRNVISNQAEAKVVLSDGFASIDQTFDHIVTNPPIRIGKKQLYALFIDAKKHLNPDGLLWLVMHKKHGALSAIEFLKQSYIVTVVKRQKGFHVIQCQNTLTI